MLKIFARKRVNPVFQQSMVFLTAAGILLTTFQLTRPSIPTGAANEPSTPPADALPPLSTKDWNEYSYEWLSLKYPHGWKAVNGTLRNFDVCASGAVDSVGENKSIQIYPLPRSVSQAAGSLLSAARTYASYVANNSIAETHPLLAAAPVVWQRECEGDVCYQTAYVEAGNKIYRIFGHNLKDTPEDNQLFSTILQSLYVKPKEDITLIAGPFPQNDDWTPIPANFLKVQGYVPTDWSVDEQYRFQASNRYRQLRFLQNPAAWFGALEPKSHRLQLSLSSFPGYKSSTTQVCADQGCAVIGLVRVHAFEKDYTGEVTKAYVHDGCGEKEVFDYFAFTITFDDVLIPSPDGSLEPLSATAVFETMEQGRMLAALLETLRVSSVN